MRVFSMGKHVFVKKARLLISEEKNGKNNNKEKQTNTSETLVMMIDFIIEIFHRHTIPMVNMKKQQQ